MSDPEFVDYYEALQVHPSADPETIDRIYRLLAERWHPYNRETGDVSKFRAVHNAYVVLSDPKARARYDETYARERGTRPRPSYPQRAAS